MENLIGNPAEARDAATRIKDAIQGMQDAIDRLNTELTNQHIDTIAGWETEFYDEWKGYYTNQFPIVVRALTGAAENLNTAADAAETINQ